MKIGIIGWGVEGQSAFRYFGPEHEYLIVSEEPRPDFPAESDKVKVQFVNSARQPGITGNVTDLSYLNGIENCDKIIYSVAGAKNLEKAYGDNADFWAKAVTIQHIFFENVKSRNLIGVTGTKGKGTTSTLTYEMLRACGKKTFLGGNIGTPVLDFIYEIGPDDWVVLELSNFQLYKLDKSPHIGVCLMITPEHLDWHPDMADYTSAKANLFRHQTPEDIAIYFAGNEHSQQIASNSPGKKIPFYQAPGAFINESGKLVIGDTEIIDKSEVKLLGEHNLQNICAALTATWFSLNEAGDQMDVAAIKKVLTTFSGLEHRLEFVRELDGVKYYDDSFGTTPDTALVALKSFKQPVVLIVGGHDKGGDYEKMALDIAEAKPKHVIAIGIIAGRIAETMKSKGFQSVTTGPANMTEIVNEARMHAEPGDIVLLSAGTSSFGMFKDYKDRGNQFKEAVKNLD